MLVCNISLRQFRTIAADIAEAAGTATDSAATLTAWLMVDDNAVARDSIDGFVGAIMVEAANADDAVDAGLLFGAVTVDEPLSAADTLVGALGAVITLNPSDKSAGITLSNGNLSATSINTSNNSVRSTTGISSGNKVYFEVTWSGTAGGASTCVGIASSSVNLGNINTSNGMCLSYQSSGAIWYNAGNTGVAIGAHGSTGTVCVAVDLVNKRFWARVGAGNWNGNATFNPATNTGGVDISTLFTSTPIYVLVGSNSTIPTATVNFGATSFAQTVPSGFAAWNTF